MSKHFLPLGSQFVGSIWLWFCLTTISIDEIQFSYVPSFTLMFHQYIVAPLMHENLSFDLDMALTLHFFSSYDGLQDLLTILDLPHLLLHHLYFPHINMPSRNHYFLLFSFVLLTFIFLCLIYTQSFASEDFAPS